MSFVTFWPPPKNMEGNFSRQCFPNKLIETLIERVRFLSFYTLNYVNNILKATDCLLISCKSINK